MGGVTHFPKWSWKPKAIPSGIDICWKSPRLAWRYWKCSFVRGLYLQCTTITQDVTTLWDWCWQMRGFHPHMHILIKSNTFSNIKLTTWSDIAMISVVLHENHGENYFLFVGEIRFCYVLETSPCDEKMFSRVLSIFGLREWPMLKSLNPWEINASSRFWFALPA